VFGHTLKNAATPGLPTVISLYHIKSLL